MAGCISYDFNCICASFVAHTLLRLPFWLLVVGRVVKFDVAVWAEDCSVVKLPSKFRVIRSRGTFPVVRECGR